MAKTIDFNQGWEFLLLGVAKLKNILQGLPEPDFTMGECMMLYTTVYEMCVQKHPCDYSQQLYDKYPEIFEDYLTSTVLPSLGNALDDECMLRQLVKAWENQKVMVKFLSRVFQYLERSLRCLPTLNEVGMICFHDVVYNNVKEDVIDAVISLIGQEREGQKIDQALVKNVVEIFVEMGMGQLYCYENDFEMAMLDDTCQYYTQKASKWIVENSSEDYMLKAEECLKQEKNRVTHYLHPTSEQKLLYKVQNVFESQFIEKEHSGYDALLEETHGMVASLRLETGPSDDYMI